MDETPALHIADRRGVKDGIASGRSISLPLPGHQFLRSPDRARAATGIHSSPEVLRPFQPLLRVDAGCGGGCHLSPHGPAPRPGPPRSGHRDRHRTERSVGCSCPAARRHGRGSRRPRRAAHDPLLASRSGRLDGRPTDCARCPDTRIPNRPRHARPGGAIRAAAKGRTGCRCAPSELSRTLAPAWPSALHRDAPPETPPHACPTDPRRQPSERRLEPRV